MYNAAQINIIAYCSFYYVHVSACKIRQKYIF